MDSSEDSAAGDRARLVREARRSVGFGKELAEKGWYHSFQLPGGARIDGLISLESQGERYARLPIPEDLGGKRVIDIGAWDGWFSFEAERHGAEVTAIDCVEVPNFLEVRQKLSSQVDYRVLDFYDLPGAGLGKFDIVFFLGVLYHLRYPLLALEIVCSVAAGVALVESFVTDGDTWRERREEIPSMEFYETDELGGELDNWIGPSVGCLMAMCRAAGFPRVELMGAHANNALVACYRRWEPEPPEPAGEPPELVSVMNTRDFGINFSGRRDEYITAWFRSGRNFHSREELRLEVDGFGAPALFVKREDDGRWLANFRFPPGLSAGWKPVRLRLADSGFSNTARVAVDMPLQADRLVLRDVCDGITWKRGQVKVEGRGFVSCWVRGLGENCDRNNVRAYAGARRLRVEWVGEPDGEGYRQVNAIVPGGLPGGQQAFRVEFAGISSAPLPLSVE